MDSPRLGNERIESLDVIRGIALCGILLLNILEFAPREDLLTGPGDLEGFELGLWHVIHLFGSGKFMSLFSLLFGAGIVLATAKGDAAGEPVTGRYLKRLGWLWVFGMLHAYLIWHGDILVSYAVTGFVLFWCRGWTARNQIISGVALLAALSLFLGLLSLLVFAFKPDLDFSDIEEEWTAELDSDLEALRGNWLMQMPVRAVWSFLIQLIGIPFFVFWIAGGMMFLGMGFLKSGFFEGRWASGGYRKLAFAGIGGGVLLCGLGAWLTELSGGKIAPMILHFQWSYWGTSLLALGYLSCAMLWCRGKAAAFLQNALAAAGRMALSNYLGQSVLMGLIFYGHGLGLKGELSFAQFMAVVPLVWIFQLTVSVLWLKWFRFGPMEWVWRCLTYGKRFPIRRPAKWDIPSP